MTYYSQRKSILNGEPQAVNNRYGDRRAMERQFHLYCANACDGEGYYEPVLQARHSSTRRNRGTRRGDSK